MQFDDTIRLVSCVLVQAIEVLGEDTEQDLPAFEFDKRSVGRVRLRGCYLLGKALARLPVSFARFGLMQEIMVVHRRILSPDGIGTAEIRDARFCTDASSGECDDLSGLLHQFGRIVKLFLDIGHDLSYDMLFSDRLTMTTFLPLSIYCFFDVLQGDEAS